RRKVRTIEGTKNTKRIQNEMSETQRHEELTTQYSQSCSPGGIFQFFALDLFGVLGDLGGSL
ncbi:MAG TPA: hypothetical protein VMP00_10005, partial [Burkholderiales bacterium]|nr:hypothetical protein [Burkholderiales bacterium]